MVQKRRSEMLSNLSRTISNGVTKLTYDPNTEKQMADEKNRAREARTRLRTVVQDATEKEQASVKDTTITPQGATFVDALIQKTNDWLTANPEALEPEITDTLYSFNDTLAKLYNDDASRLYYYNIITFWDATLIQLLNQNKISSDKGAKLRAAITKEQAWYSTNPNESIQTYQDRITEFKKVATETINDSEIMKPIVSAEDNLKKINNTAYVDSLIAAAKGAQADKKAIEDSHFSASRVAGKVATGTAAGIGIAVFIVCGLLGGAMLSNDVIVRPVSFRVLYFIYGFIFSIPVLAYFLIRAIFYNKKPHFAAFLIPLYMYDPAKEKRDSFFEQLVYYIDTPVLQLATKEYMAASVKGLGISV